jgi:hypothetical protein
VTAVDFELIFDAIEELRTSYGGDNLVIVGDLNVDRFHRPNPTQREEKTMKLIIEWLRRMEANDFGVLPDKPVVTYLDASTTLDYVLVSPLLRVSPIEWQVEEALNCQHLPLSVTIDQKSDDGVSEKLIVRQPNLSFPPPAIAATRELVSSIPSSLLAPGDPGLLYEHITRCFLVGGVEKRGMCMERGTSWWKYVPPSLRERLSELELDAQ